MTEPDESAEQPEAGAPWPADPEMSDADVAEQQREVVEEPAPVFTPEFPFEADPADAADQQRIVTGLDDEFR
ncbi:hypothetical protein [Amycolatopsis taiwanensis]|uniref:hypothetical protein n=1 Tax=Amycolatopsis taiwanensis TaxID=342230 RepID=UPI0004B3EEC2|nr:hypothetical protein [Amycolatopsis taiwanensis]